jgi:short-subunit dehydrogenase
MALITGAFNGIGLDLVKIRVSKGRDFVIYVQRTQNVVKLLITISYWASNN